MGWVMMSERELGRIEVASRVVDGSMSGTTAASVLAVSPPHIRRMVKRFREDGAAAIRHGLRGRPSNNQIETGLRADVTHLVRQHYADFGPTLAAEKLLERHGHKVSCKTLRTLMTADGLAVAQAASNVPPATAPARTRRRVDPDRRFGSSLVRSARRPLHPFCFY